MVVVVLAEVAGGAGAVVVGGVEEVEKVMVEVAVRAATWLPALSVKVLAAYVMQ